jgi:hypothetical protein
MKIYSAVFFWFGGILTQTVTELTVAELLPDAKGHAALKIKGQIRGLAEELSIGKITLSVYCKQAIALCGSREAVSDLKHNITASAPLRYPIAELIGKIPDTYERWLVVEFPMEWYEELSARWKISSLFSENRIVITSQLELKRMVPDIFYLLPRIARRTIEECVIVDALSARAVEAIKHGLASIIYVYPERLKLELALQGIWPTDADVMHPTSSERVKF